MELMIVVLIVGVLVSIAIPVFHGAAANAQKRACFSSERGLEGAYYSYLAGGGAAESVTDWSSLMTALVPSQIATEPTCPAGGTYSWDAATHEVGCTAHGSFH